MSLRILALIITFFLFPQTAQAQLKPATHVWLDSNYGFAHVPVRSVDYCRVMAEQAAKLDQSATAHCYNNDVFLMEIKCQRKNKKSSPVTCETFSEPQ